MVNTSVHNTSDSACFHCDLPVPKGLDLSVNISGAEQPMCCVGCQAVAQAIIDSGLEQYYKNRTVEAQQGKALIPDELRELEVFNHPAIQQSFVHSEGEHVKEAALILEGITCAACVWLNEQHLRKQHGIISVEVNYTTQRANVRWDQRETQLSHILEAIRLIGYEAHPYDPNRRQVLVEAQRKDILTRLGVAGIFGMQVMGLAVSLYFDDGTMSASIRGLLQRISLLLTLPVLFYAAKPFFRSALTDFRNRRFGMDTPVAIGITLAFVASVYGVITQTGEIYFDSVCMFTFFLLGARYLELAARRRAADAADLVSQATPTLANRLDDAGNSDRIPAVELQIGDHALVHPGDPIPADGIIISGVSSVDESILTGESLPRSRHIGERVIGGSINVESSLTIEITETGADTVLSGIQRLLDKAQTAKPAIAQFADRIAGWFVLFILALASTTALYWFNVQPEHWLAPTIAVLIVSCPCALSLATPAAITAGIGQLMKNGVVISQRTALEALPQIQHFFFDKTGTLTQGELSLEVTQIVNQDYATTHRDYASALEAHSEHSIAHVFTDFASPYRAMAVINQPGGGLSGTIDGALWAIGKPEYVAEITAHPLPNDIAIQLEGYTAVILANANGVVAAYGLSDRLRDDADALITWLHRRGVKTTLLTGDNVSAADHVGSQLGLDKVIAGQSPSQKLEAIRASQQIGSRIAMVGDGVNDAAVLGAADVSFAMAGAAPLAVAGSDVLLLTPKLISIKTAILTASKTLRIIKQNLFWALLYNFTAIPAAAMGYVPPWAAAIGMSLSSLIVVLNALRLRRIPNS